MANKKTSDEPKITPVDDETVQAALAKLDNGTIVSTQTVVEDRTEEDVSEAVLEYETEITDLGNGWVLETHGALKE